MSKISVIGLDLAKNVFQLHGVDDAGQVVVRKALRRKDLLRFFAQSEPCLVGMEACGGAHYWAREIGRFGHEVKMMAPAFVKPYLKSNKSDANDAEAICEATAPQYALCYPQVTGATGRATSPSRPSSIGSTARCAG